MGMSPTGRLEMGSYTAVSMKCSETKGSGGESGMKCQNACERIHACQRTETEKRREG